MLKFYVPSMDGVDISYGESGQEPLGGIWAGRYPELNSYDTKSLTMINGTIVVATQAEIDARYTAPKYKEVISEPDFINKSSGIWRVFTNEEIAAIDEAEQSAIIAQQEQDAIDYQLNKSLKLKTVENNFLLLCEQLLGSRNKASFDDLNTALTTLLSIDQGTAIVLSLKLLAIDAEAKREGGLNWWDTAEFHEDIIPTTTTTTLV